MGANLLAIRAAVGTMTRTIASKLAPINIAISSDQAARQQDAPAQTARVSRCHCRGFPLSYLVVRGCCGCACCRRVGENGGDSEIGGTVIP